MIGINDMIKNILKSESMKNKLELKHLAAYLPYNLKVTFEHDEEHTHDLVGLNYNWQGVDLISEFGDFGRAEIKLVKPMVRPLSQLEKEIEYNGGSFVPYRKLHDITDFHHTPLTVEKYPTEMPYDVVEKLFEWHFDVFGLIDKGLAVPLT